jgi:trehalose-phosphatase
MKRSAGRAGTLDRIPQEFWLGAGQAAHRLLMLDYDGTLAPFRTRRQEAVPPPGLLATLARIVAGGRTAVAVVSGRPLVELVTFIPLAGIALVGEHGFEERTAGGEWTAVAVPEESQAALEQAVRDARALGLDAHLERKRSSVVLHTRGLDAGAEPTVAAVREVWRAALAGGHRLDDIDGGLELRLGYPHKGSAVNRLIQRAPEGAFPVYVGDDATDEDAFAAVRAHGFGIKVGTSPSLARGRLAGCEQVPDFLAHWLLRVEGAPQP